MSSIEVGVTDSLLDIQPSGWYNLSMKVTIAFSDDELYRAIRVRAAQSGRQIRDIVEEALAAWLETVEDAEDVAASRDALGEYANAGGVDADEYFRRLVAESRVEYDAQPDS
jgi:plasmid stability protein